MVLTLSSLVGRNISSVKMTDRLVESLDLFCSPCGVLVLCAESEISHGRLGAGCSGLDRSLKCWDDMVESDEDMIVLSSRIADKLCGLKEAFSKLSHELLGTGCSVLDISLECWDDIVEPDEDMTVLSSRVADKLRRLKGACSKLRNRCLMDNCVLSYKCKKNESRLC